jgi:hypothetical protein
LAVRVFEQRLERGQGLRHEDELERHRSAMLPEIHIAH